LKRQIKEQEKVMFVVSHRLEDLQKKAEPRSADLHAMRARVHEVSVLQILEAILFFTHGASLEPKSLQRLIVLTTQFACLVFPSGQMAHDAQNPGSNPMRVQSIPEMGFKPSVLCLLVHCLSMSL